MSDTIMKNVAEETNKNIEKWSRVVYNIFVNALVVSTFIVLTTVSFCRYFLTELGTDSFVVYDFVK